MLLDVESSQAQIPTRPDTTRPRPDTTRRDTTARRDSVIRRDTTLRVPIPPAADSMLVRETLMRDSLRRLDSARARARAADTIKAKITEAEPPVLADPGSYHWTRRDLYSTGALTLQDLLDRVIGVTGLRTGWISQPMLPSYLGAPGRVRIFLDGLELAELDPRMNRLWDVAQTPLWAMDDVYIERSPSEIRILLRTWTVDKTIPYTRTDVYTGDLSTNLYRGYFGRRYARGEAIQAAGQQFGNTPGRNMESSDQLAILARIGIAQKHWSVDAMLLRGDRHRGLTFNDSPLDTILDTESTRSDAYVRVGWGTPDSSLWVQGIANSSRYTYGGQAQVGAVTQVDRDTSRSQSQYLLTGGYGVGPFRASFAQRFRAMDGHKYATPSARLGFVTRYLTVSAYAEGRGMDSTRRADVSAVLSPVSFVFLSGAAGVEQYQLQPDSLRFPGVSKTPTFLRGEAGVRVGGSLWLSGGVLRRDAVVLPAPRIFLRETAMVSDPALQGVFASVRGRIWKALYANAQATQWSDTGWFYRPQYETRSELYISTSMIERFPRGNFHVLASAVHQYRSSTLWPDTNQILRVTGYRTISTLLQVRIIRAELFWNFRNILGARYYNVPGYRLTRLSNIYGVRWEFWN